MENYHQCDMGQGLMITGILIYIQDHRSAKSDYLLFFHGCTSPISMRIESVLFI